MAAIHLLSQENALNLKILSLRSLGIQRSQQNTVHIIKFIIIQRNSWFQSVFQKPEKKVFFILTLTLTLFSLLILNLVEPWASEPEHRIVNIASKNFPQVSWQSELIVLADINCDSIEDAAIIGIEKDNVLLFLWFGPQQNSSKTETLRFGLRDPTSQLALCSNKPRLMMEDQKYDLYEELGENPVGYRTSERCKGLKLYDDLCDSFHIYWNHETGSLSYFRL